MLGPIMPRHTVSFFKFKVNSSQYINASEIFKIKTNFMNDGPIKGGRKILLMMLTMSSSVACTHWTEPWSNWSTSWPASCPRSQTGHGLLLLHARHGPLALHSHLEVVRKGLAPRQHLVGHDLGSELVQLVLIKGSRASRASRFQAGSEARKTGAETGSSTRAWAGATGRPRSISRTQGVLVPSGAVQWCGGRSRTTGGGG